MLDLALNPSEEVSLVEEALRVSEHTVERDINSLPTEISGHLLPYYETHSNIRSLIRQCDTDGLRHCALVPNFPCLHVPGSSLQFTLIAPDEMEHFCFVQGSVFDNNNGGEEKLLVCKKRDDAYVNVFDMLTGELRGTVFASNGELYITPNGKHLIIVDHVTEKAIKVNKGLQPIHQKFNYVLNMCIKKPKKLGQSGVKKIKKRYSFNELLELSPLDTRQTLFFTFFRCFSF